jgi:ribokinase
MSFNPGDRPPNYLLLGELRREFLITAQDDFYVDRPGGNLLYAAGGLSIWLEAGESAGFIARVGEDYPRQWLEQFHEQGFNIDGVRILPQSIDLRQFIAYTSLRERSYEEPISHFARLNQSLPKALLGYKGRETSAQDGLLTTSATTLRQADIPQDFTYAAAAHLAPMDFLSHSLMPAALRQSGLRHITVDPSIAYMESEMFDHVPQLLPGLTAFMPSEREALSLFRGKSTDLWEIASALGGYGCDFIIITLGEGGQLLYVADTGEKFEVPAYPSRTVDITGAGDAFAGGFLAGWLKTFDPLKAVLYGNVSASFTVEGSGAFFLRDTLPGLHRARLETLPGLVVRA